MAAKGGAWVKLQRSTGGTHSGSLFLSSQEARLAGIPLGRARRQGISPYELSEARLRGQIVRGQIAPNSPDARSPRGGFQFS